MFRTSAQPRQARVRLWAVAAVAALGLAGCTVDPTTGQTTNPNPSDQPFTGPMRIAMITHGDDGGFWSIVRRGATDAADTLSDVTLDYQGSAGDAKAQSDMINAAINQGANALAVSAPDTGAIGSALARAAAAAIPIITLNSGSDLVNENPAVLTHVGQSEYDAGLAAGKELSELGSDSVLCIVHEENNIGLQDRCRGATDGLGPDGKLTRIQVSGTADLSSTAREIGAAMTAHDVDAVLTLDPDIATAALQTVSGQGALLATFDLSPEVLDEIEAGQMAFAVDQQPYLQGYLPIVFLELAVRNRNTVGNHGIVATGPQLVTKENAAAVRALSEEGTR
jgi:simple sugar transport system substrate-binding protein